MRHLTASATSCAVSGLTTGHTYTFQVAATNEGGTSAYSGVSAGVVALDGAGAPSITSITPGSGSLSIAFTAPTSDGGSAITNYEYSTDGGTTFVAASPATTTSPLVITNQSTSGTPALVNNTAYQVKLRAVNAAGAGAASPDSTATPNAPCSGTISYSAATQYCVVPDGVTSMQITAIGGAGGGGSGGGNGSNGSGVGGAGGKGAQVLTSQAVTPGAVLTLKTGGGGGGGGRSISGSYGYGGGTGGTGPASTYSGGGGGGGSTLVTGTGVEIVAGGGGGGSAGVGDPANTSITRNGATGGSAGSASGAGADGAGSTGAKGLGGVGGTGGAKPSNSGNQTAGTDGITGAGGGMARPRPATASREAERVVVAMAVAAAAGLVREPRAAVPVAVRRQLAPFPSATPELGPSRVVGPREDSRGALVPTEASSSRRCLRRQPSDPSHPAVIS